MDGIEVNLFYNGQFVQDGKNWNYVNGKWVKLDHFDIRMKYHDLVHVVAKKLGLNDFFKLFYKGATNNFINVYCDKSINEMVSTKKNDGFIDIYVEDVVIGEEFGLTHGNDMNSDSRMNVHYDEGTEKEIREENYYSEENAIEYLDSEYFESSECGSFFDSDDEEDSEDAVREKSRFNEYNPDSNPSEFSLGMKFTGAREFKLAVINYAIKNSRDIKFKKNEQLRVRAVCNWSGCAWVLFASLHKASGHFVVKTFNSEHTCLPSFKCARVTAPYLAKAYKERILSHPGWKLREMRDTIKNEMSIDVSLSQCRRAKLCVMKNEFGNYKEEYTMIWDYAEALIKSNEGSTVRVNVKRDEMEIPYFWRMYICFDACKKGFLAGCRHVIGLDGCFSKGPIKFQILCAIGRDGNNQMYPIAWAVVDVENTENWKWFLNLLGEDLNMGRGYGWTLISDQQKGLEKCIKLHLPFAEHRMCARHIYANWNKKHKGGDLKKKFWRCAWSYSLAQFEENLGLLRVESEEAALDLLKTDPKHWSRAYFEDNVKSDIVDNNLAETFNKWILDARHKPIITMLEQIRCMVMSRIATIAIEGLKYANDICPNIVTKLNKSIKAMKDCKMQWNGKSGYEIIHMMKNERDEIKEYRYVVDMEKLTCTCRVWNLSGIPCPHAICAIRHMGKEPMKFVSFWYNKALHQEVYSHFLQPLVGRQDWPKTMYDRPQPPPHKDMPGRPKKHKRRELGVVPRSDGRTLTRTGQIVTCGICHKQGHNRVTCSLKKEVGTKDKRKRDNSSAN